jgi:hypothetical protein
VGGGDLKARGRFQLGSHWNLVDGMLALDVDRVMLELTRRVHPIVSGHVEIAGNKRPFLVNGALNIEELLYTENIPWERQLFENMSTLFLRNSEYDPLENPESVLLRFDLGVTGDRSVKVDNNVARLELSTDLRLVGSEQRFGLLGALSATEGTLHFQDKDLFVESFFVQFKDADRIFAHFDVLAETEEIEYQCGENESTTRIKVQVKGNEEEFNANYTADAPDLAEKSQVWSVLINGDCGLDPTTLDVGVRNLAGGLITDPIERQIGISTRIAFEPVATDSGQTRVVPRFYVSKRLTPKLSLEYSSTIDEEVDHSRVRLRYRQRDIFLQGEWDSDSLQSQGDFGIDLKFRYEF